MIKPARWEHVQDNHDRTTSRLPVPGGWLYCVVEKGEYGGIMKQHVVFVPKPVVAVGSARLAARRAAHLAEAPAMDGSHAAPAEP